MRRDLRRIDVQRDVALVVYWKVLAIGRGPSVVLEVHGREVLRFDCFGPRAGHYHVASADDGRSWRRRVYLGEPSREAQVDRACHELATGAAGFLERGRASGVRAPRLDPTALARAAAEAASTMHHFLRTVPEIGGVTGGPPGSRSAPR